MLTPQTANQKRSPRKISWDVLRVVAVYTVVVQHITHQSPINHAELGPYPFVLPLQFGASTLLVISAFFVCVTVRRGAPKRWLWNRVARLLPAYLVAVVVTYAVSRAVATSFGWYLPTHTDLLANLLLIQAWAPDFHWVDASYWTLPVQLMSFVLAALIWPRGLMRGKAIPITLWTLVVAPVVIRFVWRHDDAAQWVKSLFDGLALHRVALFGVGVAIWLWTRHRMSGPHLALYGVAVLVAQDAHSYFADTPSTIAFGVVLVGIVAAAGGPDWAVLRGLTRPIRWLAGISFGVYLVHQELGFVLARYLLDKGIGPWGRLLACVAMALLLGWAITRLVERPAHAWLTAHGPTAWAWLRSKVERQPQAPNSGGVPVSPAPSPLPASHPSTTGAGPVSSRELEWVAMASSQVR
ncbi:acyltransferase family protein [Actinokineospora globicatena]|uniref:acyltransferase family protein n=1 Tax=Actinokineospora globicatena TaxID=103729 RepID=UPI0020A50C25|nr:acyltransferase [Actinokineospora globicatena]MCP2304747.1 Peptidoglycan/LPS O-acetylase OafA/YrhL, contains acyltransferase and SGNH-hydrolase domains [Actinokineospora globicatena]GLW77877.1 acyltransferase [Actinokineospora globicatena]GLW85456.1 acyltransferase [Actinokineospora globicatena]